MMELCIGCVIIYIILNFKSLFCIDVNFGLWKYIIILKEVKRIIIYIVLSLSGFWYEFVY